MLAHDGSEGLGLVSSRESIARAARTSSPEHIGLKARDDGAAKAQSHRGSDHLVSSLALREDVALPLREACVDSAG